MPSRGGMSLKTELNLLLFSVLRKSPGKELKLDKHFCINNNKHFSLIERAYLTLSSVSLFSVLVLNSGCVAQSFFFP